MTSVRALVILALAGSAGVARAQHVQEQKLSASAPREDARFGNSVSLSGETALVGASSERPGVGQYAGAAYVFVHTDAGYVDQARLTASDGAESNYFGNSVSLAGDTAVVGAWLADHPVGPAAGAVYVFDRNGTTWTESVKLTASDAALSDHFGASVALEGDTLIVGAPGADLSGGRTDAGAAYVFVRTAAGWSEQAKLVPADAWTGRQLGAAVALSGDTAVVNGHQYGHGELSPGEVYVFVQSGTTWSEQAKPKPDGVPTFFCGAVALSGDLLVLGAPRLNHPQLWLDNQAGYAFVFRRSGTTWLHEARLQALDPTVWAHFGYSVALDGERIVVGARDADRGAAYLFRREPLFPFWSARSKLVAGDGLPGDRFGCSVALAAERALVGAEADDRTRMDIGSAYVFRAHAATVAAFHGAGINADVLDSSAAICGGSWSLSVTTGHPHGTGGALIVSVRTLAIDGPTLVSPVGGRSMQVLIGGVLLGTLTGAHDGTQGTLAPQSLPYTASGVRWAAQAIVVGGGFVDLSTAVVGVAGF